MAESMKRDKIRLLKLVNVVREELDPIKLGTPIILYSKPYILKTQTDGWSAEIGRMKTYNCSIIIIIDKFAGYSQRKCWYGFRSFIIDTIKPIKASGTKEFGKPKIITAYDVLMAKGQSKLVHAIHEKRQGVVTLEEYEKEFFYGRYEFSEIRSKKETDEMAERMATFIETISRGLPLSKPETSDSVAYPYENRKKVSQHVSRERNRFISMQRKQLDNFTCQVCSENFRKYGKYGKYGKNIAEAHHRRPLKTILKQTKTSVKDLITVCPNCHRILHRMKGVPQDIKELRQSIKRS